MEAKFQAQLWELKKDYEGEVTLKFKIPLSEVPEVMKLPVQNVISIVATVDE